MKKQVSVVVIGRNEGSRLVRCMKSVMSAGPVEGGLDLVYVDSGSTDGSAGTARAAGWRVIELRAERMTAALGRNAGWLNSLSPWILFLDGDTILQPGFLQAALAAAQSDESIAAVWGHRRELHPTVNAYHRVLDLDWVYPTGDSQFCGGDALFRRSALQQAGGFDESLIAGEEPELCSRLRAAGWRIQHIDQPMTLHDLAIGRWAQYWRRASRAGYAYAQMAWRTRRGSVRLWASEAKGNVVRTGALSALLAMSLMHPALAAASLCCFTALCLRSAARARWKSGNVVSLLLYGIHSHVQQFPILAGQIEFCWDLARNHRRQLIEYK